MAIKYCIISICLKVAVEGISAKLNPETGTPPSSRFLSSLTLNSMENKLYLFSGYDISYRDDFWEFDLKTQKWREIYPTSSVKPLPRKGSTIISLESERKILLYGGVTKYGPVSDLWLFDIEQESVRFMQWKVVDDRGTRPHKGRFFITTFYIHEGRRYLVALEAFGKSISKNHLYM
jgi:hypothetical protein